MGLGKKWTKEEEKILVDNYYRKTIFELMSMLSGRSQEGINNKIKRLKAENLIKGGKEVEALQRAYDQRDSRMM